MKKRNTLPVSGVLVIFAVLGLLSACENFFPYEPGGGRLLLDKDTLNVGEGEDLIVTVIISSKIKGDGYTLRWFLFDSADDPITGVTVTYIDGSDYTGDVINERTTLIFTVTDESAATLIIELLKDGEPTESRKVVITS